MRVARNWFAVIGALVLLIGALVVVDAITSSIGGGATGNLIVARDMDSLAQMSQMIVIGTVTSEDGVRNTARDPNDPTRPDPNLTVNSQDYSFRIEETLKGSPAGTITVTSARSASLKRGLFTQDRTYSNFVPLTVGTRYVLLLRSVDYDPGVYALALEPSRFELGTQAAVRSSWSEARTLFPDRPAEDFIRDLRAAIATAPR
jgi:hypothetical protein